MELGTKSICYGTKQYTCKYPFASRAIGYSKITELVNNNNNLVGLKAFSIEQYKMHANILCFKTQEYQLIERKKKYSRKGQTFSS